MSRRISKRDTERFLEKLREGADFTAAARACGFSKRAFYKRMERLPKFAEEVEEAREVPDSEVISALFKEAKAGNVQAIKYWLGNRRRGEWSNIDDPVHRATQPTRIEIHYDTEGEKSLQRHRRRLRLIRNDAAKKSSA